METGFEARKIVRACQSGALATTDRDSHAPYVSFCAYGCDGRGQPIFLLSDLADHTQNIAKNKHVSFLCEQASHLSNPQAGPRVTLCGEMVRLTEEKECLNFIQRHPSAKMYANFGDFNFYRLNVEKAHFVGGFGRAVWVGADQYLSDSAVTLAFQEKQEELLHCTKNEYDTFAANCATKFLKKRGKNWKVSKIDSDGVDLRLASKTARYHFEKQMKNVDEIVELMRKICS